MQVFFKNAGTNVDVKRKKDGFIFTILFIKKIALKAILQRNNRGTGKLEIMMGR